MFKTRATACVLSGWKHVNFNHAGCFFLIYWGIVSSNLLKNGSFSNLLKRGSYCRARFNRRTSDIVEHFVRWTWHNVRRNNKIVGHFVRRTWQNYIEPCYCKCVEERDVFQMYWRKGIISNLSKKGCFQICWREEVIANWREWLKRVVYF